MNSVSAMIPGSFDPPTLGHLDIISRAAKSYKNLFVVVAINPDKVYMFSEEQRKALLEGLLKSYGNIRVCIWPDMVTDFAKANGIGVIIRGVRNKKDLEYEDALASVYKSMLPGIKVEFLQCNPAFANCSSTLVKEMFRAGKDVKNLVPASVLDALAKIN